MRKTKSEKLTPKEWQARFDAAKKAAQREYCNIFKFWRACRYKPCRKTKACSGDAFACLTRRIDEIPYELKYQTRDQIVAATPADADSATDTARRFAPHHFLS